MEPTGVAWGVHRDLPTFTLEVRALLDGPFNSQLGSSMNADLVNLMPNQQPYNLTPWSYGGPESISSLYRTANPESVDWVLLELWLGDPSGTSHSMVTRESFLIQEDGSLVQPYSGSLKKNKLEFFINPEPYWVRLRHRNHLDIMSASEIDPTLGSIVLDFTSPASVYSTSDSALRDRGSAWTMWAGDGDANDTVTAFDFVNVWLPANGGPASYSAADFDMDGSISAFDFLNAWLPANGQASQLP